MPLRLWPPTSPWTCQVTLQCLTLAWPELQTSVAQMPAVVTLSGGHTFHLADAQPDPPLALSLSSLNFTGLLLPSSPSSPIPFNSRKCGASFVSTSLSVVAGVSGSALPPASPQPQTPCQIPLPSMHSSHLPQLSR